MSIGILQVDGPRESVLSLALSGYCRRADPKLDFRPGKAHVWAMCKTERSRFTLFRVCPIAGI